MYQQDVGGPLSIRGSRSDATQYIVDGVKVAYTPPQSGIEQITTITGGLPAQYGDATGGVIEITTRGPSKNYFGGIELAHSVDAFNNNLVGFDISGPLFMKKDSTGKKTDPIAGFFLSGEYTYAGDGSPYAIGAYRATPAVLANLQENPLVKSQTSTGFNPAVDYVTLGDLEHITAHLNSASQGINLSGKIDVLPSPNVTLTFGGAFTHNKSNDFTYLYELFDWDRNPETVSNSSYMYARLTQKFGNAASGERSSSVIKNAYYSIQVDYTDENGYTQSPDLGSNLFDYGYVGKFTTYRERVYNTDTAHVNGNLVVTQVQAGWLDTLVTYQPSSIN